MPGEVGEAMKAVFSKLMMKKKMKNHISISRIAQARGHYTLYNSLKNLPLTILTAFKFPAKLHNLRMLDS